MIAHWERYRSGDVPTPAIEKALQLVGQGNANEVELAFYVLMDLGLTEESLCCHVSQLAKHSSAKVRRALAFYLSRELPPGFSRSVYLELLRDKAASVRVQTIATIGMRDCKAMLPDLRALHSSERNGKVIQSLDYWIPLLEVGYRVDPSQDPGRLLVTALTGNGIASTTLEATDRHDPRIRNVVAELRSRP